MEPHVLTVTVDRDGEPSRTSFHFEDARDDVALEPIDPLPGRFNVYTGNDPERWAEGLVRHERLAYRGLYDGIDVLLRSHGGLLEYDVLLAPGADLEQVVVRCEGVERLTVDEEGGLILHTEHGPLRQTAPMTWSVREDGSTEPVECRFELLGGTRYGFELVGAPEDRAIVIDPGLEWSTYLGGPGDEAPYEMVQDSQGRLVMCGDTTSTGWMLPGGTLNTNGLTDAFVAVVDPTLPGPQQIVWWTSFGGASTDAPWDVKLNSADDVFLTGLTSSSDFPTTVDAHDRVLSGNWDGFVARLQGGTGALLHSTFIGGSGQDISYKILVEEPARVTIGGRTGSNNLPVTPTAFQSTHGGIIDYFVAVLDLDQPGAASLQYASYFGGSGVEGLWPVDLRFDMVRTPTGEIGITGIAVSSNLPAGISPAYQPNKASANDSAFFAILDLTAPAASAVQYRTYIDTAGQDVGLNVAVDPTGGFVLTGLTTSAAFPVTAGAAFPTFVGPGNTADGWLARLDPTLPPAEQLVYATYIPGTGTETSWTLEVGSDGTAYSSGSTEASEFPVTCGAFDETHNGGSDGYLIALTPAGQGIDDLRYGTFFGGSQDDFAGGIVLEETSGTPTLSTLHWTFSSDAPVTPGAYQTMHGGGGDNMLSRLRLNPFYFCFGAGNTAGPGGARICGSGSVALADNMFDLSVQDLPLQSFGFFLHSRSEVAAFALGGTSAGSLCLGTPIYRLSNFVQNSGATGQVSFRPDLGTLLPHGAMYQPGDTAYFQYWYRDLGNTSNTSNGVAVTFE